MSQVLCIGAHPDDCEGSVGGTALLLRARGHNVKFVSVTDGSRGHFSPECLQEPARLVERRRRESLELFRHCGSNRSQQRMVWIKQGKLVRARRHGFVPTFTAIAKRIIVLKARSWAF